MKIPVVKCFEIIEEQLFGEIEAIILIIKKQVRSNCSKNCVKVFGSKF